MLNAKIIAIVISIVAILGLLITNLSKEIEELGDLVPTPIPAEYVTAPENNAFTIGVRNYDVAYADYIDEGIQYKLEDKYIKFTPVIFGWKNREVSIQHIQKMADKPKWENIFEQGIDIEVLEGQRVWSKVLKVDTPDLVQLIPDNIDYIEVKFEVETNFIIDGWNKKDDFYITDTVRLGDYSYIEPAMAWDSWSSTTCEIIEDDEFCDTLRNHIQVNSYLTEDKGKLYYTKQIPTDWIKSAQFPVYTDVDINYGVASDLTDAQMTQYISTVELDTDKFVACWGYSATSYEGMCRAATVSGTSTISFGTSNQVISSLGATTLIKTITACKVDTDKFAVVYDDPSGGVGKMVIGETSTSTDIVYGTAVTFETGDIEHITCSQLDTDKFVACYDDETDSDTGKCTAATVSGTIITAGTPLPIDGAGGATDYYPKYGDTAQLDTDKFIFCFEEEETSDDPGCLVGTTATSTHITYGSFDNTETNNGTFEGVDSQSTNKFVFSWQDNTGTDGSVIGGSVSTRTISYGTKVEFVDGASSAENSRVVAIDSTHVVVVFNDTANGPAGTSIYSTTTDATPPEITIGTLEQFLGDIGGDFSDIGIDVDLISSDKIAICYQDDADSDKGKCIIGNTPSVAAPAAVIKPTQTPIKFE